MSSAAKLRKFGRGTATIATAALVMTSFGPTAFAWTAQTAASDSADAAGVASVGVVDSDTKTDGTQGAQAVTAGADNQLMGEVRFVVPSSFAANDTMTFTLGAGTGNTGASRDNRISFSSMPAVNIDPKPYAADTHVAENSSDAAASPARTVTAGSTEDHTERAYATAAPQLTNDFYKVELVTAPGGGAQAYNDQVKITFLKAYDPAVKDAKFIGTISAPKINVGSLLSGNVTVTAAGNTTIMADVAPDDGNTAMEADMVTIPATIVPGRLDVTNGAVVADGNPQFIGDITVSSANAVGVFEVTLADATFDPATEAVIKYYKADGTYLGATTDQKVKPGTTVLSATAPALATKAVISGVAVKATASTGAYTYTLSTLAGTTTALSGNLTTAGNLNQLDIKAPKGITVQSATATQVATRLGGQDRYQTAVKIAESYLQQGSGEISGESDNVVIASGEGFADALSAGYLAATKKAQLILTRQGSLPQTDIEFLKTYGAKNVFIVGGQGSVGSDVESQLRGLQSYDVQVQQQMETVTKTVYRTTLAAPSAGSLSPTATQDLTQNRAGSWSFAVDRAATAGSESITSVVLTLPAGGGTVNVNGTVTNAGDAGAAGAATFVVDGVTYTLSIPASTGDATITSTATTQQVQTSTQQPVQGADQYNEQTAVGAARKLVPLDAKLTVTRIAGADRFETNKKVNMYAAETSVAPVGRTTPAYGQAGKKTAIVANGMAPWDALAAGPLVGNSSDTAGYLPVVLTRGDTMNPHAAAQISGLDIQHLLFIGSQGVIPESVEKETTARSITFTRLGGATRWGTAKAISEFALKANAVSATNTTGGLGFGSVVTNPYLTNGGSIDGSTAGVAQGAWADALAAGPVAARERTIIALTDSRTLPQETKDLLSAHKTVLDPVIALGLGAVTSTAVVNAANAAVAD